MSKHSKVSFAIVATDKFKVVMNSAVSSFNKAGKSAKKMGGSLKKAGNGFKSIAAKILIADAALTLFSVAVASSIDNTAKFATRLGISVAELSALQFAATQSGLSIQNFNLSVQRLARRSAEAAQGLGEAKTALKELDINAKTFSQKGVDAQFQILAERFSRVGTEADKLRLAFKLFDSEGTAVLQMLKGGAASIRQMTEEAKRLGIVITQEGVQKAAAYKDALGRVEAAVKGASRAIFLELGPSLTDSANKFSEWISKNRQFIAQSVRGMIALTGEIVKIILKIGEAVQWIGIMWRDFNNVLNVQDKVVLLKDKIQAYANTIKKANVDLDNMNRMVKLGFKITPRYWQVASQKVADYSAGIRKASLEMANLQKMSLFQRLSGSSFKDASAGFNKIFEGKRKKPKGDLGGGIPKSGKSGADKAAKEKADQEKRAEARQKASEVELKRVLDLEQAKNDLIAQSTFTEEQNFQAAHEKRLEQLSAFREQGVVGIQEYNVTKEQMEAEHQRKLQRMRLQSSNAGTRFNAMDWKGRTKLIAGELTNALTLVSNQSKKMFKLNKVAGIAQAIMSTFIGVARAQEFPPPASYVLSAIALATGLANVARIKNTKFAGAAHGGLTNVPSESTFLLDRGERVLSPRQNQDLTRFLGDRQQQPGGGGSTSIVIENLNVSILENATNAESLLNMSKIEMEEIVARPIMEALNSLDAQGIRPAFVERERA